MMKRLALTALFAMLVLPVTTVLASPPPVHAGITPSGERPICGADAASVGVIARFRRPSDADLGARLLAGIARTGTSARSRRTGLFAFATPTTQTDEEYALQLMLDAPGIAYAEPDYLLGIEAYKPPSDPDLADATTYNVDGGYYLNTKRWWLDAMNAPQAWAVGQGVTYPVHGSANQIRTAVLDTGFALDHPEFSGHTLIAGRDECASYDPGTGALSTDDDVTPDQGGDASFASHGTAAAAIVGAEANGAGMVGVAWNPIVVGYKVAGPLTSPVGNLPAGTLVMPVSALVNGIVDAVDDGCRVINISLGSPKSSAAEQDAIDYAREHGVIVCAAVGNDGGPVAQYPAACAGCIGVGAVGRAGGSVNSDGALVRASYSNDAPGVVDLSAPGSAIWSAALPLGDSAGRAGGYYQFWQGTSFASPAAAGAIAYLWRAMPDLSADELIQYVENSAADNGAVGRDDEYGYGLVDMQATYDAMVADYPMLARPAVAARYVQRSALVTWTPSPGRDVAYLVTIDGSTPSTQTGTSMHLPASLGDGPHVLRVLPSSPRNWNGLSAAACTLTVDSVAPAISGFARTGPVLSWSVAEASPFEVRAYVDADASLIASGSALSVVGLPVGQHALHVEAVDAAGNSSGRRTWEFETTTSITPAIPELHDVQAAAMDARVTWAAAPGAESYQYRLDDGRHGDTLGESFLATGLAQGVTGFAVRSIARAYASDWASATITYRRATPSALTLTSLASTVRYPALSVSLTAGSLDASHDVALEQSIDDGRTWSVSPVQFGTPRIASPAQLVAPVGRNTWFRLAAANDVTPTPLSSAPVSVRYAPRVGTPALRSRPRRSRRLTLTSTLGAPSIENRTGVSFTFQRWQRVGRKYTWVTKATVPARLTMISTGWAKFSATTTLKTSGRWRATAASDRAESYIDCVSAPREFLIP